MIKAVIFDMDGVIADSQKVHAQIESHILASFGIHIDPQELTNRFSGIRIDDFFRQLFAEHGVKADIGPAVTEKRRSIVDFVKQHGAEPMPGIHKLVDLLMANKIAMAVGTASSMELANAVLSSLKLDQKITTIASGHEVVNGKPAPDIFLLAAKRLGIDPEDCVVIEDARAGMQAAKAANMKAIGLVVNRRDEYPADTLVESLEEIDLPLLQKL